MRTGPRAVLAAVVGLLAGGGGYWLAGDALVAVHVLVVYAILTWLFVGHRTAIPKGESWATNRWNGLFVVILTLGTMPYINNRLGVTVREGAALAILAYGIAAASFLVGVVMVRSAVAEGESDAQSAGAGEPS
ncbi:hypothetical protein [Halorientalis regularis]|jgi:hypothetical protein|uniref:Uncharacterized protein n=1 Tax=Halorientalis regularis TaxID=660518 RepID=A0A1G7FNR7_9EURY|nr:hypothetical protein [Halorientalis regularis]SDE77577.1 hypothetical protein SAMN05216218_101281 [Halorientalis regularis]